MGKKKKFRPPKKSLPPIVKSAGWRNVDNLTIIKVAEVSNKQPTKTEATQQPVQHSGMNIHVQHTTAVEEHVQYSDANIYIKQPEVQSPAWTRPIQQLPQSYHTPFLQTSGTNQHSSCTVTNTSGGAENVVVQKEVLELDLREEEEEEEEETEASLTNDGIEMESLDDMIEVDRSNAASLLAVWPDVVSDIAPDIWHKVIVKTPVPDRLCVLSSINKRISPLKLTPYFFRKEDGHITFLVNNCSAPLTALLRKNLVVCSKRNVIELKVQLRSKRVNLNAILKRIIRKRFLPHRPFLDLSDLINMPEFQQVMYHPSNTSHLMQELVRMTFESVPHLFSLSLAGNGMSTLRHFSKVFANKCKWWQLQVVDLSDNKIRDLQEVMLALRSLPIVELHLHKNPMCGKYQDHHTYVRVMRQYFPRLVKLDGVYLYGMQGLPQWRQNYFLCSGPSDPAELADQFVEHFFMLYDDDRMLLHGLYHEDAYFSLSSVHLTGEGTSFNAKLIAYESESHNLLHSSDKLKTKAALCKGAQKILAKLDRLPRTYHDRYSFTVDVLHHSDTSTILTVTGVFKEYNPNVSPRHFMRTFVLIRLANDEYQIVNDIMYVTNATTAESRVVAFWYPTPRKNVKKIKPSRHVTESEKRSMTERYSQLTNMRPEWSLKCLETVGWDLREALETFIEMYKADKIPESSFIT